MGEDSKYSRVCCTICVRHVFQSREDEIAVNRSVNVCTEHMCRLLGVLWQDKYHCVCVCVHVYTGPVQVLSMLFVASIFLLCNSCVASLQMLH